MIDTLVRRKGGGAVRSPLDSDPHQDAAKALFANFRLQPEAEAASQRKRTRRCHQHSAAAVPW